MSQLEYLNLDLQIERANEGYCARILQSPAGEAHCGFQLPFSDLEVENFLLRMGQAQRRTRRADTIPTEAAKAFGERLFDAIFDTSMRDCLGASVTQAEQRSVGLRIRLRLTEAPELLSLPWEYLYYPTQERFFALSDSTPIVRFLDLARPTRPLTVQLPLRILAVISSPQNYAILDAEREWAKLKSALEALTQRGLVYLERLTTASLSALQGQLRKAEYHVVHYIGHGGFDDQTQDGFLVLEDEQQRGHIVSSEYLGTLLHDHRSLRLAVLNACEGARTSVTDPFAGAAQNLVRQGIPAVIAMQFEITDEAALIFAREFYGALADGYPVDAALAEARKSIFTQSSDLEWGTPVLYTHASDGVLFKIEAIPVREVPIGGQVAPVPSPAIRAPRRKIPVTWVAVAASVVILLGAAGLLVVHPWKPRGPDATPTTSAEAPPGSLVATREPIFHPISLQPIANKYSEGGYVGSVHFDHIPFMIPSGMTNTVTTQADTLPDYPVTVTLPARMVNPRRVYLLLSAGNLFAEFNGLEVGKFRLRFASGAVQEERLIAGRNIRDWKSWDDHRTVDAVTAENVSEVWREPSSDGQEAIVDLLTIDVLPGNRTTPLIDVELVDTSVQTVASQNPAINWIGLTVEGGGSGPPPTFPLNRPFGLLTLLGYDWSEGGGSLTVGLHWLVNERLPKDRNYKSSVQLFNAKGDKIVQDDRLAGGELDPTSQWEANDELIVSHALALPEDQWPTLMLISMYWDDVKQLAPPIRVQLPPRP